MLCPNCNEEFIERCEKAFRCEHCGWLTEVDGSWHPCPEPLKPVDPPIQEVPAPGPVREKEPAESVQVKSLNADRQNVKSYLGGLVTVTETEDEENENENND